MPGTALAKWGKGHGCYVGTLTVQNVKDTLLVKYSEEVNPGKSHYPIWIPLTESIAVKKDER